VIDTRDRKTNAVVRELHLSLITKRELSNTPKLLVFKLTFIPTITYFHESWLMTERILFQIQTAAMGVCKEFTV